MAMATTMYSLTNNNRYFIDDYSAVNTPSSLQMYNTDGKTINLIGY